MSGTLSPLDETPCSRCAMLEREIEQLKEALDWQNMPNRREPVRGGYEFYVNEEWTGIRAAALGDSCGGVASLMKVRYDPDDERVRIRRVLDDDAILQELTEARESLARLSSANASDDRHLPGSTAQPQNQTPTG